MAGLWPARPHEPLAPCALTAGTASPRRRAQDAHGLAPYLRVAALVGEVVAPQRRLRVLQQPALAQRQRPQRQAQVLQGVEVAGVGVGVQESARWVGR